MIFSPLFAHLAFFVASVAAYADPLSCSGVCTDTHDPTLIRRSSDGTYYRFATGGGIPIYTTTTIQGPWVYQGEVLSGGSSIDNSGADDMWAPDVHLVGSTYYLYYAVSTFGSQTSAIGLATSTTMDPDTWTDHGSVGVSSDSTKAYNAIDPNLFVASSSSYYLQFGSFWHDIYQVAMSTALTGTAGSSSVNIAYNSSGTHSLEGSYLIYYGGYYYLFFSSGQCCSYDSDMPAAGDEYKIMVCRSTSVSSGYVDSSGTSCLSGGGTLVLGSHGTVYGPGGQGVYDDESLGWVLYYHYVDTTVGYADADKKLGINTITWTNGWPTV